MSEWGVELVNQIIDHEGEKFKPYLCSEGHLTIGVGRNLDAKGISFEESRFMLANDLVDAERDARVFFAGFDYLSRKRQIALIDMAFNLGLGGLLKFKRFQQALETKAYDVAAREMLDSKWATQVGRRATKLAQMMREG